MNKQTPLARQAIEVLKKPYIRMLIPDPSGQFSAQILELPGCVSCGKTETEAAENLERAAESWIEAALEQGCTIPPPQGDVEYSGRFALRLPRSLHSQLAILAEHDRVSLNQFIVAALAERAGQRFTTEKLVKAQEEII